VTEAEAIENIDIGGPTMVRAAAKNFDKRRSRHDPHPRRVLSDRGR
jgi:phosphoribosylaminoimidazolecarboxamide formyltransferase/IMP cyclohydrolase